MSCKGCWVSQVVAEWCNFQFRSPITAVSPAYTSASHYFFSGGSIVDGPKGFRNGIGALMVVCAPGPHARVMRKFDSMCLQIT